MIDPVTGISLSGAILSILLVIERVYSKLKKSSCTLNKDGLSVDMEQK